MGCIYLSKEGQQHVCKCLLCTQAEAVEHSPPEPAQQIPSFSLPAWGHGHPRTWLEPLKCFSFHPVFGLILVNVSFITTNNSNKTKSDVVQLETFLVSQA